MSKEINFIKHYKNVNNKLFDEETFNSTHISLYNALFQLWNGCGFQKNLSINRNDVMNLSKIGSVNTYLKCLKALDDKKYIKYIPSHNPLKGSIVNLFRFDTSSDIVVNKFNTSSDTTTDTLYKLLNNKTIKLLSDNASLVDSELAGWIKKHSHEHQDDEDNGYIAFDVFWNEYHKITKQPKDSKKPAKKYWDKLSDNEKLKAFKCINFYYDSIKNKTYLHKCRTYLGDELFNNEFKGMSKSVLNPDIPEFKYDSSNGFDVNEFNKLKADYEKTYS